MTFFRSNPMVAAFAFILVGVLCFFAGMAYGAEPSVTRTTAQAADRTQASELAPVPAYVSGGDVANAALAESWQREAWGRAVQTAMNAGAGAVSSRDEAGSSVPSVGGGGSAAAPQPSGACGGATNGADQFIMRESGGNPNAVNPSSGARGCWQLMPMHFGAGGTCSDLVPGPDDAACASRLPLSAWAL